MMIRQRPPRTLALLFSSTQRRRQSPTQEGDPIKREKGDGDGGVNDDGNDDSDDDDESDGYAVVYQRVVRPPPSLARSPALLLGGLVEYLSERHELPDRLPMVYEASASGASAQAAISSSSSDDDDGDEVLAGVDGDEIADEHVAERLLGKRAGAGGGRQGRRRKRGVRREDAIASWNSPLSPIPSATRLDVHVVGIYPSDQDSIPSWAMVVVRKRKPPSGQQQQQQLPVLLQNLFADSEKQILDHLDRRLQDVESGRVSLLDGGAARNQRQSFQQAQEEMIDDFIMLTDEERDAIFTKKESTASSSKRDNAVEADVIPNAASTNAGMRSAEPRAPSSPVSGAADRTGRAEVAEAATAPTTGRSSDASTGETSGLDFAIQAARNAASRRQQRQQQQHQQDEVRLGGTIERGDFAVEAAKRARDARVSSGTRQNEQRKRSPVEVLGPKTNGEDTITATGPQQEIDMRNIRPPILDPDNLSKRSFHATISRPQDYAKSRSVKAAAESRARKAPQPTTAAEATRIADGVISSRTARPSKRKLNVVVQQSDGDDAAPRTIRQEDVAGVSDEQVTATNEVLDELAATEGSDLTAEELLRSVMEFGDGHDQQDLQEEGSGFASGAFGTAKDILREQSVHREERLPQPFPSVLTSEPGLKDVKSPDEEIRRMFEAGERIAEQRLSVAAAPGSLSDPTAWSAADEQLVDSLVAKEKSIAGHARVLDDELTELELQINRSPEEIKEANRKPNPMFDIFSGPEVYNPNVDPETAVNWPGALPGTRSAINSPRELEEAIKQARFAASVLENLEERQSESSEGKAASPDAAEYFVGDRQLTREQVLNLQLVVKEAVETGLIEDPLLIVAERSRLQMLLDELWHQPNERYREIASSYKDLLLSDHFVQLVKERMNAMAERDIEALRRDDDSLEQSHSQERAILGTLVGYAQLLLKETRALGAELEAQHLELIRSICKVAMDPRYTTEEDTASALTDAVRNMRPLFDDSFVAYLKYAVAEEEGRLARAGHLDDPDHNQWLCVLRIVQQGVYKELERGISRYIDHIWYVLRMETPSERGLLLKKLVDVMPTMDVRPFVQVVENIAGSLGDSATGDFDGAATLGEMTNKLLQLRRDVRELLPPERIALMSQHADEWAASQKQRLIEQRRKTQQLLEGARQTEHLDDELEALGRRGEVERIE